MTLRPKNWGAFQHYRTRRPPWIKLHRSLLDDEDFDALKGEDAKHLIKIWLIASEHDNGELPSLVRLAYRLHLKTKNAEQLVSRLKAWLQVDASTVLADGKQHAIPRERKRTEEEGEGDAREARPPQPAPLRDPEPADWDADEEAGIPDDLPSAPMGAFLLQRLSIPHSYSLAVKFADAVDLLARDESCGRSEAARNLLKRARDNPPPDGKWRFWLEDGKWQPARELSIEGLE